MTTTTAEAHPALATIRDAIDQLDDELRALIARRIELARAAAHAKSGRDLFRPEREHAVLARAASGPVAPALGRAVWTQLIAGALMAEGVAEIVVATEALRVPALLRFGQVLPVRVAADAALHAARPDALVIMAAPPPGCVALDAVVDADGRTVGHVVGPAGVRR